ncbi:acryloyl-CoA reductase [Devosia rhodophyticola]|uniref:Acryloyl-CoA reductase n=1 Tax=Devosia rhodophyticola TaxID=3026423 RepID=A0ABY7Z1V6_9HYPH|nr:acryloyl-CoA reductase [Devosia rhodophyticola]WDR07472.1 acryloyl-CoA reductase [Devosia rhodophyticola]
MTFKALVTDKSAEGKLSSQVQTLEDEQLPEGDVVVDIDWAGFNYKDGLCLKGAGGLVRNFPHVAGIDFAGRVRASDDARYAAGQEVVLTGWRVGENHWGGFSQRARVKADWLVPLPKGLSGREAMIVGTAGLTAMLAIDRLERAGLTPAAGEVLVTGAGGVGSIAVAMLAKLGYSVTALSGRAELSEALKAFRANAILDRAAFMEEADKPLEAARWAGVIDAVGGAVLGKLLRQVKYGGAVAAIGNAAGIELNTNVLPFILRGVALLGIDSVMQPYEARVAAWARLADIFDIKAYGGFVAEIGLADLPDAADRILAGSVKGRLIVKP